MVVGLHKESGKQWAVKVVKKKPSDQNMSAQLQREIAIMKRVIHPYIVQLGEVYETPKNVYIIMEMYGANEFSFLWI